MVKNASLSAVQAWPRRPHLDFDSGDSQCSQNDLVQQTLLLLDGLSIRRFLLHGCELATSLQKAEVILN